MQLCDNVLARGDLPFSRKAKPQVAVTLTAEDLFGAEVAPTVAQTGFGAVLSAARARWLACDAELTRIVLGPEGQPLDYGRSRRLVPAGSRKAVVVRDQHCGVVRCAQRRLHRPAPLVRVAPPGPVDPRRETSSENSAHREDALPRHL